MILIVRHGVGRGRQLRYLGATLAHLADSRPALSRALRIHETGNPFPPLDDVSVVLFALGDPLREWYPDCYAQAVELARRGRDRGIRLVNPPESLSNSIKSVQARIWRDAGIPTPEHHRFESADALGELLEGLTWPAIVRPDEAHEQRAARLCTSPKQAEATVARRRFSFPGSVTPVVDVRESHRRAGGSGIWARYHHKKRLVVLGRTTHADHVFFSEQPIVASATCTFHREDQARFPALYRLNRWRRACIDADVDYWRNGVSARTEDLMRHAARILELEFAALDYGERADGSVVIWEANPHFDIPPVEARMLARERRALERCASFHDALGDFFEELLG